jgi:hypothetical protein
LPALRFHVGNSRSRCKARAHPLANVMLLTQNLRLGWIGGIMSDFAPGRGSLGGGTILAAALWVWPAAGWAYTAEQQQACMGDAFSLCGSEIPDVQRVTACMVRKQAELSPGCRVYFRAEQTAVKPIRPHRLRKRVASDADWD